MAGRLTLRTPTVDDAIYLARNLREDDRREVEATAGPDIERAVLATLALSVDPIACFIDDRLAIMFGIAPVSMVSGHGCPWILGTERCRPHCSVARVVYRYLSEVRRVYPLLVNHVDVRNEVGVRLMLWLGFEASGPEPFGVAGLPFYRVELRS